MKQHSMKNLAHMNDKRNGWYEITPEDAAALVETQPRNRPLSQWRAARYADSIRTGNFVPNGESLVLDHDGNLTDGQHRLKACVMAAKSIITYVVYMPHHRVESDWFDTIDTGKARSNSDRLAIAGAPNYVLASMVARLAILHGRGQLGSHDAVVPHEVRKAYEENQDEIDNAVEVVQGVRKRFTGWAPVGAVMFCYMMVRRIDPVKADEWLHAFSSGANLSTENAIYKVREALQQEALSKSRGMDSQEKMALLIRSWVYFRWGYEPRFIVWRQGAGDPMPDFSDTVLHAVKARDRRVRSGNSNGRTRAAV